jgi:sigma-B regulation protein RsbU (phosphoserine phosphatase)
MAARRILLVEDSSTMRRMISALLQDVGYEVATAEDGVLGLIAAKQVQPELILTDYEMPEMDGPALCKALKLDPEVRSIPVIMLTTLGASESKVVGLDSGADDYIQKPRNPGEIQELYARIRAQLRISDLRGELADRNRQLEGAKKKVDLELDLARKVQHALMPKPPKATGSMRMAVKYTPANVLGGDVYDFYRLPDGRLGILVADVSGHGVNSAMLSGMVKALASPLAQATTEPGEVLAGLDTGLESYFPEGYFCTGFYLMLDEATGEVEYAGVGHPSAIVVGPGPTRLFESNPGLLGIGLVDATSAARDRLMPGETLVIYTDGLPDAMDPGDVMFGENRLKALLETHKHANAAEIIAQVESAVAAHVSPGSASDDINIVVIQYPAS